MTKVSPNLHGKVALVTGASRGIGRGIALQLGQAGATVYITGRQPAESMQNHEAFTGALPSLEQTKKEIEERGGKAVLVYCDHSQPEDVKALFERIDEETNGQLDILVNNAYSAVVPFYECEPSMWDAVNNVGLRNHYYCAVYASRMMVKRKSGLIVNISSIGGLKYAFNVAYGTGKAALDRMAADMAVELKDTGVTIISLWPAAVKTEAAQVLVASGKRQEVLKTNKDVIDASMKHGETTEFAGKCIVHLAGDRNINLKSGKVLFTSDIARQYGFKDVDGQVPMDMRSLSLALKFVGWQKLASIIPSCFKVPLVGMHFATYKFE